MNRRKKEAEVRVADHISLGVLAKTFRAEQVNRILEAHGRASQRQRDLPAQVMVYYVIALALYMREGYEEVLRCLLEGMRQLLAFEQVVTVATKGAITQARGRLGWEVLRQLYDEVVRPVAGPNTRGAWYRRWKLVSLDGSVLDVADTPENEQAFGRPGASRGSSAYPQMRFVSLVENGTHVLFGAQMGRCDTGETTLAKKTVAELKAGMLCLADRLFYSFKLWNKARASGADLLWRVKKNMRLPCLKRLSLREGSPAPDQRRDGTGNRISAGGRCGVRIDLSITDDDLGPGRGAGTGTGRSLSRALGNRNHAGRVEDPPARSPNCAAQPDAGTGSARVLGLPARPLCDPWSDA